MFGVLVGIILALGAAFSNAISKVMVRKGTDTGRSDDVLLIVTLINLAVIVPIAALIHYPEYGLTPQSLLAFVIAGILTSLLGRVLNFKSIERIGASRTVPIVAAHAVVAVISAAIILGDRPGLIHIIGILFVIAGVVTISWDTSRHSARSVSRRELLIGLAFPIGAALFYGLEPTVAKLGFQEGTPFFVGLSVRVIVALIAFTAFLSVTQRLPTTSKLLAEKDNVKWYFVAGLGNTLFLLGYYAALTVAPVSVVAPLLPTDILFTLVLSAIWLPERLEKVTIKTILAGLLVMGGVVMITGVA